MFKIYHFSAILLSIALSNNALADCNAATLVPNAFTTLKGYTGSQEEHHTNGQLWDYKTAGSGDPAAIAIITTTTRIKVNIGCCATVK